MIHIRLPGHQLPATAGYRRTQLQAVHVGIGLRGIHAGGVFHIPFFLATDHALHIEAVIRHPGAVQAALGVLEGAPDLIAIAVFVILGFFVTSRQPNVIVTITHSSTAVGQPALAIIRPAEGEVAGGAIAIGKGWRCRRGDYLAAGNGAPAQGLVAGTDFQYLGQRGAEPTGGRIHPVRAGTFHPHAVEQHIDPFLATDHRVQTTPAQSGQRY